MLNFFIHYGGTIFVGLLVFIVVLLIVLKMRRDKKKGRSSCGGNCGHCPSSGMCHKS